MRAQRIITDEPEGVCVGFELSKEELDEFGLSADLWQIQSDNGGENDVPEIHDVGCSGIDPSCVGVISLREEPEDWQAASFIPLGPDMEVWRSREQFDEWLEENQL
jgi:hypothetical protein